MLIQKKLIKEMDRAAYNPRVELRPGDDEYEACLLYTSRTILHTRKGVSPKGTS